MQGINTTRCYIERDGCYLMLHRVKKKNDLNHDKWIGIGGKFEDKERGLSQNDKSTLRQPLLRKLRKSNEIVLKKSATIQKGIASFQNCCVFSVLC